MRALYLLCLSLACGTALRAEEFVSAILPGHWHADSFQWGQPEPAKIKAPALGPGPLFDLSDFLAKSLVPLSPGGQALYAPATKRFYIKDTAEQVATYEAMFGGGCWPYALKVRLEIINPEQPAAAPFSSIECRCTPGQLHTVKWGPNSENVFELEPVLGPDGHLIDCRLKLKFKQGGNTFETAASIYIIAGQPSSMLSFTVEGTEPRHHSTAARLCATVEEVKPDEAETRRQRLALARKVDQELAASAAASTK